jgi:hypothetical protein
MKEGRREIRRNKGKGILWDGKKCLFSAELPCLNNFISVNRKFAATARHFLSPPRKASSSHSFIHTKAAVQTMQVCPRVRGRAEASRAEPSRAES